MATDINYYIHGNSAALFPAPGGSVCLPLNISAVEGADYQLCGPINACTQWGKIYDSAKALQFSLQ
jgi:hypothetical protein